MSQRVISFHYTLTDTSGTVLDSSKDREALSFIEGAGHIIPGLEKQIAPLKPGDKKRISVAAAEAYGTRNEQMVVKLTPDKLPTQEVKIGDRFSGGQGANAPVFVVTAVTPGEVTLDGNHPLAGVDLTFDVDITSVREATADELSHGHAHGEHGHSH